MRVAVNIMFNWCLIIHVNAYSKNMNSFLKKNKFIMMWGLKCWSKKKRSHVLYMKWACKCVSTVQDCSGRDLNRVRLLLTWLWKLYSYVQWVLVSWPKLSWSEDSASQCSAQNDGQVLLYAALCVCVCMFMYSRTGVSKRTSASTFKN